MLITELLNQYRDLVKYMMKLSGCAKINKSIWRYSSPLKVWP